MPPRPLTRLRKLCLALPDAREVESWGTPTFRVKTIFAMYAAPDSHHGEGREGVWIKATKVNQALMVQMAPDRFFVPPYVGPSGWVGVYIDSPHTDWDELTELLRDGWRMSAPKKLVAKHESGASVAASPTRPTERASKSGAKKKTSTKASKRGTKRATKGAAKRAAKQTKPTRKPAKKQTAKGATRRTTKRTTKRTTTSKRTR